MDSPRIHNPELKINIPKIETVRNNDFPFFKIMILNYFQNIMRSMGRQNHYHAF